MHFGDGLPTGKDSIRANIVQHGAAIRLQIAISPMILSTYGAKIPIEFAVLNKKYYVSTANSTRSLTP